MFFSCRPHRTLLRRIIVLATFTHSAAFASVASPTITIASFIATAEADHPRQTEGDIVVLRDCTLLAAWSDFHGHANDHAPARISAARSSDGGRTWGARFTLQENTGRSNVMSASFVRSPTGEILFFYLQKNSTTDRKVYVHRSTDDSQTWGPPVLIMSEPGYHVKNNARVIQLKTGRLLAPVPALHKSA